MNSHPPTPCRDVDLLAFVVLPGWRDKAVCLDEDPDLFFPAGTTGHALEQIKKAKMVCRRCEVAQVCREFALDTGQDAGVWGGKSEDERRAMRRLRQRRAARSRS